jgi:N-acetylmuramoyl-L-alanine amidase
MRGLGGLSVLSVLSVRNVLNALRALRAPRSIHACLVPRVLGLFGLALAAGVVQAGGDAPPACDRATFAIAIDPGHTRAEPGATSARGVSERAFNEALSAQVVATLRRAGFGRTFATHPDDAPSLALVERTRIAAERGARLFVSIHHDSVQPQHLQTWLHRGSARHQTPSIRGHSLFVSGRDGETAESLRFARLFGTELRRDCLAPTLHHAEPVAGENRALIDRALGIYRHDELAVLRSASMPAVLFEAGVIVHRGEELRLRKPAHRRRLANALTRAAIAFCEGREPAPIATPRCR